VRPPLVEPASKRTFISDRGSRFLVSDDSRSDDVPPDDEADTAALTGVAASSPDHSSARTAAAFSVAQVNVCESGVDAPTAIHAMTMCGSDVPEYFCATAVVHPAGSVTNSDSRPMIRATITFPAFGDGRLTVS
jgi:hypothetical protein